MEAPTDIPARLQSTAHPVLYEVNARVLTYELERRLGHAATLDDVPDALLDEWAGDGFDAVWLMGAWTTGEIGRSLALAYEGLRDEYRRVLPDFTADDVIGSPYAVRAYAVSPALGGDAAMARLRARLRQRGLGLVLDFVCNHTARDHAWISRHPEFYVQGKPGEEKEKPGLFFRAATGKGERTIAFGRDPYFPGWTDTAQLNYECPELRAAVTGELGRVAAMCDGVRCDMAMLVLREVFRKTWGAYVAPRGEEMPEEFWPGAIAAVRRTRPQFLFVAEAYWDLEWELQQLGFSYTYDKVLYDRLLREGAAAVRDHLRADMDFQLRSVRFIENHDEPPAACALPSEPWHFAAATVAATVPGMLMLHDGQMECRDVRVPVQLRRRPAVPPNARSRAFYRALLRVIDHPVFRRGAWQQLFPRAAWHDNHSWQNFLSFWWHLENGGDRLVVVNYAPRNSQCYLDLPGASLSGSVLDFRDLMGPASYQRERTALQNRGMFFDLQPYGFHIFEVIFS